MKYYPIMTRADGRGLDRLDLASLDVLVAGINGNPQRSGCQPGKDNFAPRLGAIYRFNEKSVVRGGYGITYNARDGRERCAGTTTIP